MTETSDGRNVPKNYHIEICPECGYENICGNGVWWYTCMDCEESIDLRACKGDFDKCNESCVVYDICPIPSGDKDA